MASGTTKTVLITGASSGIGMSTALYLAQKGYTVIGTSRSYDRLSDLRNKASGLGVKIDTVEMDINKDTSVDGIFPQVLREHGQIDVLINNAGYSLYGPVESVSMEEIKAQYEANVFGAFRLIKAVLPGMMERRQGTIINISSVVGRIATPFNGAYASSKFALEGLSEAMRVELWPFGVRVAIVEPGIFRTKFIENQVHAASLKTENSPYLPYIEKSNRIHKRFEGYSPDPIKVARVIHRIIKSKNPSLRHPVGIEARLGMLGARVMPERLYRYLLSKAIFG